MKVASWADRHARSILFLLLALVIGGVAASLVLPVSLFPKTNFPTIRINIDAGERPAERMAIEITRPMEESLRAIPGVRSVHSTTGRGAAEIWLKFDWGQDMVTTLLQAQNQVGRILPTLPTGTNISVLRMDPSVFSTISYSLTSDKHSLAELRDLAQYQLRPLLLRVEGVARVDVQGGAIEEYRVEIDPDKLRAVGLSLSDVTTALKDTNVLEGAGLLEDHYHMYLVATDTRFKSLDEIGSTVLKSSSAGVILLKNVATIRRDAAPQFIRATSDGHDAVLFDVYQQPGANTVQIAQGIRSALEQEKKLIPADIKLSNWYDQSDLILASAHSVRDAVLIGVGLAALVLLLFLRNWRITLVAAMAVPVVLAVTALLLYLLGQSFNMMTLGGMAAAVGLIIDDAIVMSEHIVRRLHGSRGADARQRVLNAADEFSKPLTGSSLSTIIIHIPPAFAVGVAGAFFASLSLAMAASLIVSYLVAWLAIPTLAARFLKDQPVQSNEGKVGRYERIMRNVLAHPIPYLFLALLVAGAGLLALATLENGFMPKMDEGGFIIDYVAPPGTSLTETDRMLKQVEEIIRKTPEVETYSRRTGFGLGGDFKEPNTGDFFVRLKDFPRRPIEQVMDDIRKQAETTVPSMELEMPQLMEDILGDITGRPEPVVINLFSEDENVLLKLAPKVKEAVEKVPGVLEVKSGIVPAGDGIDVQVDRIKASLEGVDADEVSRQLNIALSGNAATQMQTGDKLVDVRVWIPGQRRRTIQDVEDLPLRAADGHIFPLKRISQLKMVTGQPEITRQDTKRMVAVTGRIENRDLGSTIKDVRAVLDGKGLLPAGVTYTLGGLYEEQQLAFRGLVMVILAGATLVFILLLYLYESFRVAIAILLTTITAIAAVFIGLWITRTQLTVSSLMGMVMIVGNVTEVAIFYYSEFADFPHPGSTIDRLIAAGTYRMRAITMTTVAAILALLPLALGIGHGSAMLQPLAIAIISGLVVQLPLVLFLLPALLLVMRKNSDIASNPA